MVYEGPLQALETLQHGNANELASGVGEQRPTKVSYGFIFRLSSHHMSNLQPKVLAYIPAYILSFITAMTLRLSGCHSEGGPGLLLPQVPRELISVGTCVLIYRSLKDPAHRLENCQLHYISLFWPVENILAILIVAKNQKPEELRNLGLW